MATEMKMILKSALLSALFTVVLLTLIHFFFTHSWYLFSSTSSDARFTVQGSATLTDKPDQALVSFVVKKTAVKLEDAQTQANTATNTVVTDLKKMGIEEKDIKTSSYNSYPIYNQNGDEKVTNDSYSSGSSEVFQPPMPIAPPSKATSQTITGYTVSQSVTVTIHDISKASQVIDAITKDGAENIYGPNFTFSNSRQKSLTDKARLAAITDAKQKAQNMAKAAGIRLGRVLDVQENGVYPMRTMEGKTIDSNGNMGGVTTQNVTPPTNLNPGESIITENVTLSYETW